MTDPEFDREIRQKLEAGFEDDSAGSWALLEKKLDNRQILIRKRRRLFFLAFSICAVAFISGLGYILVSNTQVSQSDLEFGKRPRTGRTILNDEKPSHEKRQLPLNHRPGLLENDKSVLQIAGGESGKSLSALHHEIKHGHLIGFFKSASGGRPNDERQEIFKKPFEVEASSADTTAVQTASASIKDSTTKTLVNKPRIATKATDQKTGSKPGATPRSHYDRNWMLSFSVAPENNATSFNVIKGQTGISLGADLGLNFSPRWTLGAGLAYSVKLYKYVPWVYTAKTSSSPINGSISANCKVLEIPLTIKYNLVEGSRSTFYLGSGISSYFLLKEDYSYLSAQDKGTQLYSETIHNRNQNILSVFEFMAGYKLKMSGSSSLGVQPFIKIPITPVGEHRYVDISAGAALILSFDLHKRN